MKVPPTDVHLARGWRDGSRHDLLIAESSAMRAVVEAASAAARSDGGVLVCGESGSGRRLLARHVHRAGRGDERPFVQVDCSEGGAEEIERRLFGVPSDGDVPAGGGPVRIGVDGELQHARGGTLFLARVTDLPPRAQERLAAALAGGEVLTGGSSVPTWLELRVIASATPAWDTAVAEGRIRSDLARRLSAIRIDVPPLRERREDIPPLASSILTQECDARGIANKTLDPPALALLSALPWRGNARELRELLAPLAAQVPARIVRLEDVLARVKLDGTARAFVASGTLREARSRFEREYITAVLEHHHGRIAETARDLGIQRTNLYRKLRALRLPRSQREGGSGA